MDATISRINVELISCQTCKHPLSYFPIHFLKGNLICGRCFQEDKNAVQCIAYEAIAENHSFPCRYKKQGCLQEHTPEKIPNHEASCSFRLLKCSVVSDCNWQGMRSQVAEHCHKEHLDLFIEEDKVFHIPVESSSRVSKYMMRKNMIFSISWQLYREEGRLYFYVKYFDKELDKEKFIYQVTLQFLKRFCFTEVEVGIETNLIYSELTSQDLSSLTACFSVGKSNEYLYNEHQTTVAGHVASMLKCHKCDQCVPPPIYIFNKTYIYCQSCAPAKEKVKAPSFAMTDLAYTIKYPCKFSNEGCPNVSLIRAESEHLKFCEYEETKCIYRKSKKCKWAGPRKNATNHYTQNHDVASSGGIFRIPIELSADYTYSETFLYRLDNHCFRVILSINNQVLHMHAEKIIPVKTDFRYEIQLIDMNTSGYRQVMRKAVNEVNMDDLAFHCSMPIPEIFPFFLLLNDGNAQLYFAVSMFYE